MAQRLRIQKLVNEVGALQGLATTDSPTFANPIVTTLNIGHATDTTLARSGAGDITVEGNAVYRAGGTDVAVADGGTGASSAAGARTNLGAAASGANTDITSLAATGAVTSSSATAGMGYATGAGGTVTQITSKATGVTLNKICGQITTHNAALGAGAEVSFTVSNSTVSATDVVVLNLASGNTADAYTTWVDAVGAGSFRVGLSNLTGGSLSEALVLNFVVIKGVTS
jgi:hypothetical protein